MADVTGEARDELELPAAALALVREGRAAIAARRAAELAEAERRAAAELERAVNLFAPVRAAVAAAVPADLMQYVDWRTDEFLPAHNHEVTLRVPGCIPVQVPLEAAEAGGWRLWTGYFVRGVAHETLAMALADARRARLDDDDIPF